VSKKAFTLIELLVVIAIIAMLTGILMPSLARAREQGREIYCQSNLHQMHIAAMVYTQTQRDFFPISRYNTKTTTQKAQLCWDFTVRMFSDKTKKTEPGILWQGDTIEKVQQCPSFKGSANMFDNPYTGYNYNTSYIGRGQGEAVPQSARVQDVRSPSSCILFGDGQTVGGANKFMRSPLPSEFDSWFSGRYGGTQGYRHSGSTNLIWCDGSADSKDEFFIGNNDDGTLDILLDENKLHPRTPFGFISENNSLYDLR
jgi:prepilin-type N-terminal cleavage/methylation domain-containing protein/prepilin-type processing-associated H-X9-DG protein